MAAMVLVEPRRQDHDVVAGLQNPAHDAPGVAAVVVVLVGLGTQHVLHREAGIDQVAVAGDVHLFEVVQQRRPLVPGHVGRSVDHVVAVQRRHRDEGEVGDVELGGELPELVLDLVEPLLAVVDEVHLVDAQHQVRDPEQRREEGVPA